MSARFDYPSQWLAPQAITALVPGIVLAVTGLVLVGWWIDLGLLKSVFSHLPTMTPNVAVGLAFLAVALVCVRSVSPGQRRFRLGVMLATASVLIGGITLAEYVLDRDLGVDHALLPGSAVAGQPIIVGRPSFQSAMALVLLGLAIGLLDVSPRRGPRPSDALALLAALVALLALIGHACSVPSFYGMRSSLPYVGMALHTAVLVTALALGVLAARPTVGLMAVLRSASAGGLVARRLLLVPVVLPMSVGLLRIAGDKAGLRVPELSNWLFAFANIVVFTLIIWWCSSALLVAEARRTEAEQRFRAVAENAQEAIVSADGDGVIVYVNASAERMFGYSAAEAIGQPLTLLMPERYRADHAAGLARLLATGAGNVLGKTVELAGLRRDGAEFPLELSLSRWRMGTAPFFTGVIRDIRARKQAERELVDLNARLTLANKELEAFSYSVSHDLRAPLRAMNGFARILVDEYAGQLPAEASRYLFRVQENAKQMGCLVDELLNFSRLARQPLNKHVVALADVVHQAVLDQKAEAPDRRVDLVVGPLPPCEGDPGLLKHVFVNLISNAFKFTSQQSDARIEIGCRTDLANGLPVYFVKDNGVGFDMRYADKLFGVFQRLHRADEFTGTGVGLAIAQRVVARHGGRIWAEAAPHQGATFFCTLAGE